MRWINTDQGELSINHLVSAHSVQPLPYKKGISLSIYRWRDRSGRASHVQCSAPSMWPRLDSQPWFSDATVHGASKFTPTTGLPSSGFRIFRPRALDCPSSYSVLRHSIPKNNQPHVHSLSQKPPLPWHLSNLPSSDALQAETVFTGVWPVQVHVTPGSEGSHGWFNALVSTILKFLTILSLNLCL